MMIWTIVGLLLLFWVLGLVFHIAGGLIHLLLVIAAVVIIFKFISGRTKNRA
ncbi:lmo0937 family membrane protein [Neobacillus cucumis]|uniref:lmo0937 family membrane protein n=1 Tax=Neobacillus cucumis TaxID=1740721 RepID=UPI0035A85032